MGTCGCAMWPSHQILCLTKKGKAMETITMCDGAAPTGAASICFRLKDGGQTFYHSTGINARPEDAARNPALLCELNRHCLAMCKAYTLMQVKRMDMNNRIFELQVQRVMAERAGLVSQQD